VASAGTRESRVVLGPTHGGGARHGVGQEDGLAEALPVAWGLHSFTLELNLSNSRTPS